MFSRNGKKIVWRANHPTTPEGMARYDVLLKENLTAPMKMELWVSDADGRNARQITKNNCANFAPTFTPDGKKIVFSSNQHKCDGRDFELYMVNLDGTGQEQITNFGGFSSFPEFSPDGKRLVFSSSWKTTSRFEFNIFVGEWVP